MVFSGSFFRNKNSLIFLGINCSVKCCNESLHRETSSQAQHSFKNLNVNYILCSDTSINSSTIEKNPMKAFPWDLLAFDTTLKDRTHYLEVFRLSTAYRHLLKSTRATGIQAPSTQCMGSEFSLNLSKGDVHFC